MKNSIAVAMLLSVVASVEAHAATKVITLDCSPENGGRNGPIGGPRYKVLKKATKGSDGRWQSTFVLRVQPMNPTVEPTDFALKPGGDGDEDYGQYDVVGGARRHLAIQSVDIQNRFQWATLIDTHGVGTHHCE